jgi:hypothetical protein
MDAFDYQLNDKNIFKRERKNGKKEKESPIASRSRIKCKVVPVK